MSNPLDSFQDQKDLLAIKEQQMLTSMLRSNDPMDILKAQRYISSTEGKGNQASGMKSFLFSPEHEFYSTLGFKSSPTSVTYSTLRNMARVPIIRAVINTRLEQASAYNVFTTDEQKKGWTIRRKKSVFDDSKTKLTEQDKHKIEDIVQFIENSGVEANS